MNKNQIIILSSLILLACVVLAILSATIFEFSMPQPQSQSIAQATLHSSATFTIELAKTEPAVVSTSMIKATSTDTPTPAPTPTNTRVVPPTLSPTPRPTYELKKNPISTATLAPISTSIQQVVETPPPPDIRFWADSTTISYGTCTKLNWHIEKVIAYWVDGQPGTGATGNRTVCPNSTQTFELKYQVATENNLVKTDSQVLTVLVDGPAGGSSANAEYKASVCQGLRRDLNRAANDRDAVASVRVKDEMELWQCDGDPNYIPTVCDLLALFRQWAVSDRDAIRIIELERKMQQEGCQ